jgi:hypothetical protein
MKNIQLIMEAKVDDFAKRYLNIHKDHPLIESNPEEATSLIKHAHQFAQGHDESIYLTRQLLDKTYKPVEDDTTITSTLSKWRRAKTQGLISGNLSSHTHDTISQTLRDIPGLDMQKNKASALQGMEKYKIGHIDHSEHGKLGVYHILKSDINDDKEYENISSSLRKTCSGSSWCVLPKEHGPTHLKHYSHGHGIFFYTNDKGTPVLSHGFGDRGIVRPDNSVVEKEESVTIKKQTSSLLKGEKKEKYDFFSGNNTLSVEKQHKMYDEFGDSHAAAHFADRQMDTHPEILERLLKHPRPSVRENAIRHPNVTAAHIDTALKDTNTYVRSSAIEHPNVTAAHIDTTLKDTDQNVRSSAIRHPNVTAAHIDTALKDTDIHVRQAAIQHPNVTAAHIDTALKHTDPWTRRFAIRHPNVTAAHIDTALKDTDEDVRWGAIQHPNVTAAHIDTALKHTDSYVRRAAIHHPNVTAAHIDTALKDTDQNVRWGAIHHPNATAAHIDTALKDTDIHVRRAAIQHPNVTAAHIDTALKDTSTYVRRLAIEHPDATAAHIDTALKDENYDVKIIANRKKYQLEKSQLKESKYTILNNFKDMITKRNLINEIANKASMPCNKPRRSTRPGKKMMVKACEGEKEKIVHFGDSSMPHNYSSGARKSFRARHKCGEKKSKLSAQYWACRKLWAGPKGSKKACRHSRCK